VFTPKHGSWLNLIESFFGKMAQSFLRGIRVTSKAELKERIFRYFEELNRTPTIYRWTYKLDTITSA
ncbi:MAG TPA: IS630 family transposase, partial [Atribacteraceae bacterium]|nr:IS630 family transposase [Atribacteraceae bacterium]